ncbi:MAG: hypothetical protein V2B19_30140 [Pseudomonadota bacterium]
MPNIKPIPSDRKGRATTVLAKVGAFKTIYRLHHADNQSLTQAGIVKTLYDPVAWTGKRLKKSSRS